MGRSHNILRYSTMLEIMNGNYFDFQPYSTQDLSRKLVNLSF